MGARPYAPALGRFLSVDPVGGSANDYEYAMGDPVNNFDLDGRYCVTGRNRNGSCRSLSRGAGRAVRSVHRHLEVGGGVCPVFGCVGVSYRHGHVSVSGGVGLAVSFPGAGANWARNTPQQRGWSRSNSVFLSTPVGSVGRQWTGNDMRRGDWVVSPGLNRQPRDTPGWGGGYVQNRTYTS